MALKVWLPLNGDLHNQGCSDVIVTGNNLTSNATGKIGSCYNFNGSSSYINLNAALLNSSTKEFSYCCWVKFNVLNKNQCLFSNRTKVGQTGFSIIYITPNKFYFDAGSRLTITVPITLVTGQWYHFAFTFKNSDSTIDKRAYINGEEMINAGGQVPDALANATQSFIGASQNSSTTVSDNYLNGSLNDVRIYNHCLSVAEVREISQGLVLHYKLDGFQDGNGNPNLGNTSATYSNQTNGTTITAGAWGGDAGTVTFYHSGGYNGLPYKIYHKTATGSGGIYKKTLDDIVIESGVTYTMSCWIKADRQFNASHYSFNINRGVGNRYITYGNGFTIYTDWHYYSKTFTATDDDAGNYGEMSIIYDDAVTDYYVYYSGFKIEKGSVATPWCSPNALLNIIQDSSGYNHNAISNGSQSVSVDTDTPKYSYSTKFISGSRIAMPVASSTCLPTNAITVSIWYKSSAGTARFLSCTEGGGWNFEVSSSKASFPFYINSKGYGRIISTKNFYSDNQWHMITVTYDGISTGKWYWDGILDNTITIASGWENLPIKYNTNTPLTLGAEAQTIASPIAGTYVGNLSDLRIYCTALDADAIRQLYEVGAKVDNKQNLHTFELAELNSGKELINTYLTPSYANHTTMWNGYDENGEITLIGNSHLGSPYIKVNPINKKYIFDADISIDANNQVFIGFQRYDAAKTTRQNDATLYAVNIKPSSSQKHKHYHFIYNTNFNSFDANTPIDTISLRVLNDWSNAANREMTIHKMSFREVPIIEPSKINKKGQVITDELMEMNKYTRIQKDGIVETKQLIEL